MDESIPVEYDENDKFKEKSDTQCLDVIEKVPYEMAFGNFCCMAV